jgi:hypothetical protein
MAVTLNPKQVVTSEELLRSQSVQEKWTWGQVLKYKSRSDSLASHILKEMVVCLRVHYMLRPAR